MFYADSLLVEATVGSACLIHLESIRFGVGALYGTFKLYDTKDSGFILGFNITYRYSLW